MAWIIPREMPAGGTERKQLSGWNNDSFQREIQQASRIYSRQAKLMGAQRSEVVLSGGVVMKLASTLPEGQNDKIYADNYPLCPIGSGAPSSWSSLRGNSQRGTPTQLQPWGRKEFEEKGERKLWPQSGGEPPHLCRRMVKTCLWFGGPDDSTLGQSHQDLYWGWGTLHCGYLQQINGSCGFVGLICSPVQVPNETHLHILAHPYPRIFKQDCKALKIARKDILNRR